MEADGLDLERLIGEVAHRHNLLLSRDDPVLVTVTLNEILLARALARLKETLEAADLRIASGADRHVAVAKEIASQLINSAADYAEKVIREAARDAADRIVETCRSQHDAEPKKQTALQENRTAACWAAIIAALHPSLRRS